MNIKNIGGIFIKPDGSKTTLPESFYYAFRGIYYSLFERNVRIHYLLAIIAIITGKIYNISDFGWCLVIIFIALIISMEMINTAIEILVDIISPKWSKDAGKIKDLAAGAVLVLALAAVLVAYIIFVP